MTLKAKIRGASIVKAGNSYAVRIPKALIDTEVLKIDEEYEIDIVSAVSLIPVESIVNDSPFISQFEANESI